MKNSIDKILEDSGLDFEIIKTQMSGFIKTSDTESLMITSPYYGLVNSATNEIIHSVSKHYVPSQNKQLLEQVLKGLEGFENKVEFHKGYSINGGRKILLQLKVTGKAKIGVGEFSEYINIVDSNDGSTSVAIGIGHQDAWCENMFFSFNNSAKFRFRHSSSLKDNLEIIPELIENAMEQNFNLTEKLRKLEKINISEEIKDTLVNHLLGFDRTTTKEELKELKIGSLRMSDMNALYSSIGVELADRGENLLGLFSGVTRFTTHNMRTPKREHGELEHLVMGRGYRLNNKALNFISKEI